MERRNSSGTLSDPVAAEAPERVVISGIQMLVRIALEQARLDRAAGRRIGGFVSGYRGSPLGGIDQELWRRADLLAQHDVVFRPGLNEDLAATAVWGSQRVRLLDNAKYEDVFGIWYGKAPGVDRSGDALRHANFTGTSPMGGVLAICGDDPDCKSSTLPSQSEFALRDLEIPVLAPATVAEILEYGLAGIAMSRHSGCWTALIVTPDLMDSRATFVPPAPPRFLFPPREDSAHGGPHAREHDVPQMLEPRMRELKLPAALDFARANGINRIVAAAPGATVGVIAAGRAFSVLTTAFEELGEDVPPPGLRVLKLGMPWPLDPMILAEFAQGLETILVVEDKRPMIEDQLRTILYDWPERPKILGKGIIPLSGSVAVADAIRGLAALAGPAAGLAKAWLAHEGAAPLALAPLAKRMPYYCSGCPHNRSTKLPEGSKAVAGIGCHYMAQWISEGTLACTHMGGEGATWLGQEPFVENGHIFANMGDGTYSHSGLLAIRAAIAANARITYKILLNNAVAMTGGQPVEGEVTAASIAAQLRAEGVGEIVLVAEDPDRHSAADLPAGVAIHPRQDMDQVQRRVRERPGVSVIIYDQGCAAEKRRKRKRNPELEPSRRIFINEAVCEGCGDCTVQSNCISVEPAETVLGTKRRINQGSCNKDYSCVEGFCPSFVSVEGAGLRLEGAPVAPAALPEPVLAEFGAGYNILATGIGGTGVTTLSAIIAQAATLEGLSCTTLDMTGLAQKGGAVTSHIRIARKGAPASGRIPPATADLIMAADLMVAAGAESLAMMKRGRTRIIANRQVAPVGEAVRDPAAPTGPSRYLGRLALYAELAGTADIADEAQRRFGDAMFGNVIMLGMAVQKGLIPLPAAALEQAIRLNGAAVETNLAAFAFGRGLALEPVKAEPVRTPAPSAAMVARDRARRLVAYQDRAYADKYRALVAEVGRADIALTGRQGPLTLAVAKNLYKLMAYKDEYEVARLHAAPEFRAALDRTFAAGGKVSFHLAPPLLARRDPATGRPRKMRFGPWLMKGFRLLRHFKVLRGSWADPFGHMPERKLERNLIREYKSLVRQLIAGLDEANYQEIVEILDAADRIRGYGMVKEANLAKVRAFWAERLAKLGGPETEAKRRVA